MRRILPILALCLFVVSCGNHVTAPEGVPDPPDVPVPRQVPDDAIPQPFGETFYFKYGWDQQEGPEPILEMLLTQGVRIRAAWVPDPDSPGPCMVFAQMTQLVVELRRPDPHMTDYGFTSDAGNVHLGVCNPHWLEYYFSR